MKPIIDKHLNVESKSGKQKDRYRDICLSPDYVQLYEGKENGITETFHFKCDYGEIEHSYLKREIPIKVHGETYYDLTSAYGFGGPIVRETNNVEELFKQYNAAFNEECKANKIVSAFYRFHIIESREASQNFDGHLDYIGPNVVKDLSQSIDQNMHKSVRTSYRSALKKGLHAQFDTSENALDTFLTVYEDTMKRNDASTYYYFDPSFFRELCRKLDGHYVFSQAVLDGKVIASFITLLGSTHAFGFLGGTLTDYYSYDASTFLEYETMNWLKGRGLQTYLLGGGMDGEDNLFRFKKKFDKEGIYPYFVGKKVFNKDVYDQLVAIRKQEVTLSSTDPYFPLYRR